jgi:hypothetical protein
MRSTVALALLLSVVASSAAAQVAITRSKIEGPNGIIRHVQVLRLPASSTPSDCQAVLQAAREIPRRSVIEGQACESELSADLAPLQKGLPIRDGYAILYVDSVLGLASLPVIDIYFYEFNPGLPSQVCERALARYRERDSSAKCLAPAAS